MLICNKCGVELTEKNWCRRISRNHICNDCWNKYRRKWYHSNQKYREQQNGYMKNYRENQKRIVFIHYGGNPPKCACCGETELDFLTLDHINNDGAEQRRKIFGKERTGGGLEFNIWLIKNDFPEGIQILCYNCNCGKRVNNGICPHKKKFINKL
jgi:hypothetical protein